MSQQQVLATLEACLQDVVDGLAAKVTALAAVVATDPATIRVDFNFVKWKLAGAMQPARTPNVMLRPGRWSVGLKQANHRDGVTNVEVGAEWFDADPSVLQDNIVITATALAQVLDGLRDYSDAHGGSIVDVIDPIEFLFGEFSGPASSGFTAAIQIQERSAQ
jgi:hypothetical protein